MTSRRAHPAVTFFGTLIHSVLFVSSISSFLVYRFRIQFFVYRFAFSFTFSFLSRFTFGFRLFRVFFRGFIVEFSFCRDCANHFWGGWNHTCWPLNFRLRWLYASRLSSCGLSFLSFSFFFFLLPFSFNSSFLLLSSGNRTAKLVPIPFCSRDLPESYLLLLFSPTFFLCSWCSTF
jgi:hypothetical protein